MRKNPNNSPQALTAALCCVLAAFNLLTGAMLFSAVFLLNEPYTCAHHRIGRILYGVLVGAATMGFRYFGVYDTGVCFALLTVNSISGWLDRTETRLYRLLNRKEDAE